MQVRNNRFLSDGFGRFDCPFCASRFTLSELRDELSQREAGISGLCQDCQDDVFGGDDE